MRVLVVSTNRNQYPVAVMPYGACIVAEAAERAGHAVRFLDFMFRRPQAALAALARELRSFKPDVVGFSVRNIDNNDLHRPVMFFRELAPVMRLIREHAQAVTVLGGAAVGIMPEAFLRFTGASFAVCGNGEEVFPRLLEALEKGGEPEALPGVVSRRAERAEAFRVNEPFRTESPEHLAVPRFPRWIDVRTYATHLATAPLQTKRGCPFDCTYCTYSISEGRRYRLADPGSVVASVRKLVGADLKDIEFVDNVFNAPYDHAMAVCEALARARLGARFQTVELNPAFTDGALLSAMEQAGFVGIGITAESASDRVLAALGKNYGAREVNLAAEAVGRSNLSSLWMFMLGGPGETEESARETLRFAAESIRPTDVAFFNVGVRIYPGTLLERRARNEALLAKHPDEMLEVATYYSPAVDAGWLRTAVRAAVESRDNFIDSDSLSLSFLPSLYRFGRNIGLAQPIWKHIRSMKRGLKFFGVNV